MFTRHRDGWTVAALGGLALFLYGFRRPALRWALLDALTLRRTERRAGEHSEQHERDAPACGGTSATRPGVRNR